MFNRNKIKKLESKVKDHRNIIDRLIKVCSQPKPLFKIGDSFDSDKILIVGHNVMRNNRRHELISSYFDISMFEWMYVLKDQFNNVQTFSESKVDSLKKL